MEQNTTKAIDRLLNNTTSRFNWIKRVMDRLPEAKKYDVDALLKNARSDVERTAKNKVDASTAKTIANKLTVKHIIEYIIHIKQQEEDNEQKQEDPPQEEAAPADPPQESLGTKARLNKQAVIDAALKEKGWRLEPALKRARLYDPTVTMEDVKAWRVENKNLEKRPRKFNSWVANRAKEEYQADLFFFDDLRQRVKVKKGDATRTVREPVEYNAGLLVVDTFSKKIAVVPLNRKTGGNLRIALDKAFEQLGSKPEMLYTDAEAGLTGKQTQEWLRQEEVAHNITLKHAPVAERMIGHIKNQIFYAMKEKPDKKWWEVVDDVVDDYNMNHISRSTQMTPNKAARSKNRDQVKARLESIRKSDNPQPRINQGDKVRVVIKKKFAKGYMPDWSEEVYTVSNRVFRDETTLGRLASAAVTERQAMYGLEDPNGTLPTAKKGMFARSELLLVRKAN
jgi:hypothetical protein